MATSQIVIVAVGVIALIICVTLAKKTLRVVLTLATLLVTCISYGLLTPKQVIDTASLIKDKGVSAYQSIADASDNIKVAGQSISVMFGDTWVDINSIADYKVSGDTVTVTVGGKEYTVTDKNVAKLFNSF